MIKKVLIANRGEIACRIVKAAKKLGIKTVAIYSHADEAALHVELADEAVCLETDSEKSSLQNTYLNSQKIIDIAKQVHADAIHPGYGFLSEQAQFAQQCVSSGLIFIGPPATVIKLMGSKDAAKEVVEKIGVPVLPGYHGENQETDFLLKQAEHIGFPVLLKAAGGGGGKGMRIVSNAIEFASELAAAKRESLSSFNCDKIILEKYLSHPRHIEIQIAADEQGHVVHLFERDCSIQRRYQKVIEEAPVEDLSTSLREKLYEAAIAIAKHIAYVGVGTIECLVEADHFYFMEMNTRLQVEHPVTELITQQDLVEWQFIIANKQALPLVQTEIKRRGYAIEARLCAEDPLQQYLPSSGKISHLVWPMGVRVDAGVRQGDTVSMHYDSLLAKIIAWGETRAEAVSVLAKAIDDIEIVGITTNRELIKNLLALPDYHEAKLSTQFIPQHVESLFLTRKTDWHHVLPLASLYLLHTHRSFQNAPWSQLLGFRLNQLPESVFYFYADQALSLIVTQLSAWETPLENVQYEIKSPLFDHAVRVTALSVRIVRQASATWGVISAMLNDIFYEAKILKLENKLHIFCRGWHDVIQEKMDFLVLVQETDNACIRAPIPGTIVAILVKEGDIVNKGQPLLVMEAMKMEHTISAMQAGTVSQLRYKVRDQVEEGAEMMRIDTDGHTQDS
ncbi:MAG: biotin/lipoyl-binding protein [Gammaproteobacteria bacterium]|nr:biotin/lipoyl-binding protein [Gammaproteobacteria bacterium]